MNSKYSYFVTLAAAKGKGRVVAKSQLHTQMKNCFTVHTHGSKISLNARTAKLVASG